MAVDAINTSSLLSAAQAASSSSTSSSSNTESSSAGLSLDSFSDILQTYLTTQGSSSSLLSGLGALSGSSSSSGLSDYLALSMLGGSSDGLSGLGGSDSNSELMMTLLASLADSEKKNSSPSAETTTPGNVANASTQTSASGTNTPSSTGSTTESSTATDAATSTAASSQTNLSPSEQIVQMKQDILSKVQNYRAQGRAKIENLRASVESSVNKMA